MRAFAAIRHDICLVYGPRLHATYKTIVEDLVQYDEIPFALDCQMPEVLAVVQQKVEARGQVMEKWAEL